MQKKEDRRTVKIRRKKSLYGGLAGTIVAFGIVLSVILAGLENTSSSVKENGRRVAEDAIKRAAVSCYSLEGSYPESYEYLKENYAVEVNEALYIVNYTIFASNIMPDITVIER